MLISNGRRFFKISNTGRPLCSWMNGCPANINDWISTNAIYKKSKKYIYSEREGEKEKQGGNRRAKGKKGAMRATMTYCGCDTVF